MADQREEFALREFDSRAGAVAVAEAPVVVEVGEFGQRFFVGGGVGGVEPAVGEKFVAGGVCGFFAGDEARGGMLVSTCVCVCGVRIQKKARADDEGKVGLTSGLRGKLLLWEYGSLRRHHLP